MGYPEKIVFVDKVNRRPVTDPDGQLSANEANEIRDKLNKNALFHDVHDDLAALQAAFPNPPKGAFAYLLDGSCYRCVNVGWTTDPTQPGGGGGATYFKGYYIESGGQTALEKLQAAYPDGEPGWRAVLRVVGGNDREAIWDEDDGNWFSFEFSAGVSQAYVDQKDDELRALIEAQGGGGTKLTKFNSGWITGYSYQPTAEWTYNGLPDNFTGPITLDPADATYDRYDIFVIDLTTAQVITIKGDPAVNPEPKSYDPVTQLYCGQVRVTAGSLEPENVNEVVVYNQNLGGPNEFNINPGVNGNTADTSDPYDGTYAIKVTNWQSLEKITATPDAPISIDIVKQLAFRVKNISGGLFVVRIEGKKSNGQQDSFSIYPSSFGYDYQNTANYQYISMSMPNNNLATLTAIHIVCGANGLSMLFDKIRIISGDAVVINPEYATVQALEQAKQEVEAYADLGDADLQLQINDAEDEIAIHEQRLDDAEIEIAKKEKEFAISNETTAFVADPATPVFSYRWLLPFPGMKIPMLQVIGAPTGSKLEIDVHKNGVSIFSTTLTVDIGEYLSINAAVPAVMTAASIDWAVGDLMEVFVLDPGTTDAAFGGKMLIKNY